MKPLRDLGKREKFCCCLTFFALFLLPVAKPSGPGTVRVVVGGGQGQ